MKMFLSLIFLLSLTPAFATLDAEYPEIVKYYKKEFLNPKNYAPAGPNETPPLTKEYYDRLMKDEKELKYFYICALSARLHYKYNQDKAFAGQLEKQFGLKRKLTKEELSRATKAMASMIYTDTTDHMKKGLEDVAHSNAYFKGLFDKMSQVSFK